MVDLPVPDGAHMIFNPSLWDNIVFHISEARDKCLIYNESLFNSNWDNVFRGSVFRFFLLIWPSIWDTIIKKSEIFKFFNLFDTKLRFHLLHNDLTWLATHTQVCIFFYLSASSIVWLLNYFPQFPCFFPSNGLYVVLGKLCNYSNRQKLSIFVQKFHIKVLDSKL